MVLLIVTAFLFPVLYLTLELPKRIINDAIAADGNTIEMFGFAFGQITFLALLCIAFLVAVLVHGMLKMRINTMKGILSERMLRRLRYQLIGRILRFPQPYFERTSQGELVSMVTSESEPMGGLMGDALAQPVLQAGQMITILSFLFMQSVWFGLASVALIPLQGWLIPKLQRQINQLNKKRIKEVRQLASEIGESAAGASTLRANGGWRYRMALISDRLSKLFDIRLEVYKKKFFMKFLNNFITQLTPFFFFSIGGYLVIQGNISLGALVAALAAYKDLSSPWKELLTYYNQVQDMSLRWDVIMERFAPADMVSTDLIDGTPDEFPRLNGDIQLDGVSVRDPEGNAILQDLNARLPAGATVGIAAASTEDRRALAELLTREVTPSNGTIHVAGHDFGKLHQGVVAARIGHVTNRPVMFQGTFGENVTMPLKPRPFMTDNDLVVSAENQRAGNGPDVLGAKWLDPGIADLTSAKDLEAWWLELTKDEGSNLALFRRILDQSFETGTHSDLMQKLVDVRPTIMDNIQKAGLARHVHLFDVDTYNPALPVGHNLLFAIPLQTVTPETLVSQIGLIAFLRRLNLFDGLLKLSQDVVDMLHHTFGIDGTDHPLFRKLGLDVKTYETAVEVCVKIGQSDAAQLNETELSQLFTIPFSISAEQIGPAFSDEMKDRILALRKTHSEVLRDRMEGIFTPLDIASYIPGLTVFENAVFGKLADTAGAKADEVKKIVMDTISEAGWKPLIMQLAFEIPITLGGQNLPARIAETLSFCRATIKRPDIVVMEQALSSYDKETRAAVQRNLRTLMPDATVIYLDEEFEKTDEFDHFFEVRQGRVVSAETEEAVAEEGVAGANLTQKLRALEQTDLFAGLNRRQLRLLAFGAKWFEAKAGEYVFYKDDDPTDGAYVILDGEAGLYLPVDDGADKQIATVSQGALVGELGLIRGEPRALDMMAETDLRALRIGAEEFLAVVENDAATAYKLLQVVAGYVSR